MTDSRITPKPPKRKWEIWKNGRFFAGFEEGFPCRRGGVFGNDDDALSEFDDCIRFWESKGVTANWELRIQRPNGAISQPAQDR